MEELLIANNLIASIEENAFLNLPNLEYLDLSGNSLTSIRQIDSALILSKIYKINLQLNKIEEIPKDEIEDALAKSSKTLSQLKLLGNPIKCDCQVCRFLVKICHFLAKMDIFEEKFKRIKF